MPYIVKDSCVSIPGRDAYRGEIITDEELEGVDAQRLLDLGAIAAFEEVEATVLPSDADAVPESENQPKTIDEFNRKELDELAASLGVDEPEKLRSKAAVLEAIKLAQDTASDTETVVLSELSDDELQAIAAELKIDTTDMDREQIIEAICDSQNGV